MWKSKIDLTNFSRRVVGVVSAGSQKVPAWEASVLAIQRAAVQYVGVSGLQPWC